MKKKYRKVILIFLITIMLGISTSNADHIPGETVIQLTDNDYYDDQLRLSEQGDTVWLGYDGNDWEIFLAPAKSH